MILVTALAGIGCGTSAPPAVQPSPAAKSLTAVKPLPRGIRVPPPGLTGCYALYDEAGQPASRSLAFASERVRLGMKPYGRPGTWRGVQLGADGGLPEGQRRTVYWAVDSLAADTIHIHNHTGFSGSQLIFGVRPASDTLHGRALEHWDIGPSTNDAGRVTAVRVACVPGVGLSTPIPVVPPRLLPPRSDRRRPR